MDIITLLLTACGLAADAFSVSVTGGICLRRFKVRYAFKTGAFFGTFQFLMPCLGWFLGYGFSDLISKYAPVIAFGLLAFVGGKMIFEAVFPKTEETANPLDNKIMTLLAVATSIDALAVGITFAAMELSFLGVRFSVLHNSLVIGLVAFAFSAAGVYIGNKSGDIFGNKAQIAGGIVLIGIGIKMLAELFI